MSQSIHVPRLSQGKGPLLAGIYLMITATIINFAANAYITSFFLSHYPGSWLSYLYMAQSLILMIVTTSIGRYVSKNIRGRSILCLLLGVALIFLSFISLKVNPHVTAFIFCIVIYLVFQVAALNSSNYVAMIMDMREYKRNISWLVSSASITGILSAYFQSVLVGFGGIYILLVVIIVMLVGTFPIYLLFEPREHKELKSASKRDAIHYPLFNYMFIYIVSVSLISILAEFGFKYQLSLEYNPDQIARYISLVLSACSVFAALLQIFMLKRVQKSYGFFGLFISFPLIIFVSSLLFSINISVMTATILYGCTNILYYSFINSAREQSLNVLPQKIRIRGKFLTKGIATPGGGLIAALFAWVIAHYLGQIYVGLVILATSAILVYLAFKIEKFYQVTLKEALVLRRFDNADQDLKAYSSDQIKSIVEEMMQQPNAQFNLLGIKLLPKLYHGHIPAQLIPFMTDKKVDLRIAAITAVNEIHDPNVGQLLNDCINTEKDTRVLCHLLVALEKVSPDISLARAVSLLDKDDAILRAMACSIVLHHGGIELVAKAVNIIQQMMHSDDPNDRASAAASFERITIGDLREEMKALIRDPNIKVSRHAIHSATIIKNRHVILAICEQLSREEVSYTAMMALVRFGNDIIPAVLSFYQQTDASVQMKLIKVLTKIPGALSEEVLLNHVDLNNIQTLNTLAKHLAYRVNRETANAKLRTFANTMLTHEVCVVRALSHLANKEISSFLRGEIYSRIRLAKIRFLYWLSIAEESDIVKVVPLIISRLNQKKHLTFLKSLELIETYISKNALHVDYVHALFEDSSNIDELVPNTIEDESIYVDTWIKQILSHERSKNMWESRMMNNLQKMMALRNCILFNELPSEVLLAIADVAQSREVYVNERIYNKGEMANAIYIVASGHVEIGDEKKILMQVKEGGFFGIIAILEDTQFKANATALEDGLILYIEKEAFDRITEDLPEVMRVITRLLIKYLCEIAINANTDKKELMQVFKFS